MTKATRRDVLRTIAAAGAGAASLSVLNAEGSLAAGSASKAASIGRAQEENHELTWAINATSGTEIDLVQAVVDKFVELNPNYKVEVLNYDPVTYDQKLLTDISAGTLPDLFVSADVFTKPFFESNLTADLTPLAAETGYDVEAIRESRQQFALMPVLEVREVAEQRYLHAEP